MSNEDHRMFISSRSEPHFNPDPIPRPAQPPNESIFPAELLDSGFEWTEILTGEVGSVNFRK
jgi:hypothetical protein